MIHRLAKTRQLEIKNESVKFRLLKKKHRSKVHASFNPQVNPQDTIPLELVSPGTFPSVKFFPFNFFSFWLHLN